MSNLPINSPIKGPGLTKPGVIVLQFLVIFLFQAVELLVRSSLGIITAMAIWIAFFWCNLPRPSGHLICGRSFTTDLTFNLFIDFNANNWRRILSAN